MALSELYTKVCAKRKVLPFIAYYFVYLHDMVGNLVNMYTFGSDIMLSKINGWVKLSLVIARDIWFNSFSLVVLVILP